MSKELMPNKEEMKSDRINGFIIECLFSRYFEEKAETEVEAKKEEIRT